MLPLPERGLNRSVHKHNCAWGAIFDWVQGTVVLGQERVSKAAVADVLCDAGVYVSPETVDEVAEGTAVGSKQDLVNNAMDIVWIELGRRHHWLGGASPYAFSADWIEPSRPWDSVPAYAFCLLLALTEWYKGWNTAALGGSYNEQGSLFERLSAESLTAHGWEVEIVGWSPTRPVHFADAVQQVAAFMREEPRVNEPLIELYRDNHELGLDLVCRRRFRDERPSLPFFLVQCASGDWHEKAHTPDVDTWREIVPFAAEPRRAFTMPFAFESDDEFYRGAKRTHVVLIDRYRLLGVGKAENEWVSAGLHANLVEWVTPRVASILAYDPA